MRIITVASNKGGVGKTTITFNLADCLTKRGYKVLCIDADPQANLTKYLKIDIEDESVKTIYDTIVRQEDVFTPVQTDRNIDLIVGDPRMSNFEAVVSSDEVLRMMPAMLFRRLISGLSRYDFVLVDTKPSIDLTTNNALVMSDYVIIPVTSGDMSVDGLMRTTRAVDIVRRSTNANLKIIGAVVNMYSANTISSKELMQFFDDHKNFLFSATLRQTEAVRYSENNLLSIMEQKRNEAIKKDFNAFVDELLDRIK